MSQSPAVIANLKGMRAAQTKLHSSAASSSGGSFNGRELLKLEKGTGDWVFGQDVYPLGTAQVAVNPLSFQHGIIAWGDAADVLGENMVPIAQDAPRKNEQVDPALPWVVQVSFEAAIVSGPDEGTQLLFKTTALGGKEFVSSLFDEICENADEDPDHPVPVITLGETHYKHKKWGRIYKAEFDLVSWVQLDAASLGESAPEPEPAEEPVAEETTPRRRQATRARRA